jgi:hypothetical protein
MSFLSGEFKMTGSLLLLMLVFVEELNLITTHSRKTVAVKEPLALFT